MPRYSATATRAGRVMCQAIATAATNIAADSRKGMPGRCQPPSRAIDQAKAFAGDRDISVNAGQIGGQALREGLIDQVVLNLVPAVLGSGRPFFAGGGLAEPLLFDDPRVVKGSRVTHLVYDVRPATQPQSPS